MRPIRKLGPALVAAFVVACASKPPPPPVIETQEAKLDPSRGGPATETSSKPASNDDASFGFGALTGGGKPAPTPSGAGPATAPATDATPGPPEVTLLDAGSAPKKELRHVFAVGAKQKLVMKSKTRVTGANLPIPPISLTVPMSSKVVKVNKAGDARFEFSAGPFQTGMGGGGLGALGGLLGGGGGGGSSKKFAGWGWITARGVIREYHVEEGAENGDAPVESGDPFPEEAVGVAARWKVKQILDDKDGPVEQLTVYRLVKLDVAKKLVVTSFERTQVPTGGGGAGAAKSSGDLIFHLGDVYPTGKLSMARAMAIDVPGMTGSLKLVSDVVIQKR
jgi:hypothetical protein